MMTQNEIDRFAFLNDVDAATVAKVAQWFDAHAYDYQDRMTAEVNWTGLTEAAAMQFELYEDDSDYVIPEWLYELAPLAG